MGERPLDGNWIEFNRPHGPVTIGELTAGLVWPRLLRLPVIASRPARVLLGTATVLVMWWAARLIGMLTESADAAGKKAQGVAVSVLRDVGDGVGDAAAGLVGLDLRRVLDGLSLAWTAPGIHSDRWVVLSASMLVLGGVFFAGGLAICRSAAVEIAGDVDLTVRRAVVFSLRRLGTLLAAALIPLGAAAVLSLVLKAGGWALFSLPGVSVVGAVLYPVAVILGLAYTLVWLGFVLGNCLLAPAVAVENADAIDAVQRAYSYVIGRPLRTGLYLALTAALFALGLMVASWLLGLAEGVAGANAAAWLSPERAGVVNGTGDSTSAWMMAQMKWLVGMVVAGWGVSAFFSGSTLLYLVLRRVHDEQDEHEVWMAGMVGGTLAPTPVKDAG